MTSARTKAEWLEHRYFRTYQIADFTEAVVSDPFAFISDLLQNLVANDGVYAFLAHWQKQSALHRFVAFIADQLFSADCEGPRLVSLGSGRRDPLMLPVDAAMSLYGLDDDPFIPDPSLREPDGDSVALENAYYDYFVELRFSGAYEALLEHIAEEVFFVMFSNRVALQSLNAFLSMYVRELDSESFGPEESDLADLFGDDGVIVRKTPPKWARAAVFFREQGLCAQCGADLTGLLSALPPRHFDHMVPLAKGGLNDVTNLQLLCEACNLRKGARHSETSRRHRRWYRM